MNFQANYPIYLQIAEDIKRRIVIGELKAGDKLPSNAELALAYQVNPNTVQRIYRQLEAEGISYTKRGIGTFLMENPEMPEQLRQEIGFVFQDFRLLENKTVLENVALASQVIGKPRHYILSAVPEALDLVGLAGKERRLPHELSGGEQQRVAIARAMVNRPKLLLADEPTGNLDPSTSVGIMRLLDRINRQGTTVVMATHDDEIVDQMRKRVIELKGGEVVRDQDRGVYGSDR